MTQVHISLVGADKMRISWVTKDDTPPVVHYGRAPGRLESSATGGTRSYRYLMYKSGTIHDVVIGPLTPDTVYYYRCGPSGSEFSFKTPPSQLPLRFAVAGPYLPPVCDNFNSYTRSVLRFDFLPLCRWFWADGVDQFHPATRFGIRLRRAPSGRRLVVRRFLPAIVGLFRAAGGASG